MMIQTHIPSTKQVAIYKAWKETDYNLVISAVAGSGKTSALLGLMELCEYIALFVAFNKSIQEETQAKLDKRGLTQGKALTMHSMGLSALRRAYRKVFINKGKNFDLIKVLQDNNKKLFKDLPWKEKLALTYCLMDMNDASRNFLTDDIKEIDTHLVTMGKNISSHPDREKLWHMLIDIRKDTYKGGIANIDFIDMIYIPVIKKLYIPFEPVYLFVDECQDLNLSQHALIDLLLSQGTVEKWCMVGDPRQSIYGFAGAYSNSFDMILQKDNVLELPLDICYRSDKKIIDSANLVYPVMEAFSQDDGIVDYITDPSQIKEGSMVICRNTTPLLELYFTLLQQEKPCYIKGKEILVNLQKFAKPWMKDSIDDAKDEMIEKEIELGKDKSDRASYNLWIHQENYNNFCILANHFDPETVADLFTKLEKIFKEEDSEGIMLCTIHKAKGLESGVVYILNEHLIPSKFARTPEQLKQESNLKYVARTRARKELYFLTIKEKE